MLMCSLAKEWEEEFNKSRRPQSLLPWVASPEVLESIEDAPNIHDEEY